MNPQRTLSWRHAPPSLRALGRWVVIAQVVGYSTALLFVRQTTGITPEGVASRYRGADSSLASDAAMQFPKLLSEMLTITHTHMLGMTVIFVLSGLGLALCERPSERWRTLLIVEPFVALLVSFSSMWLMRYVDARFSWLLILSSALMAATFYLQSLLTLRELGLKSEPS